MRGMRFRKIRGAGRRLIDEGVYSLEGREDLIDNDEISAEEEGFMRGWDEAL